MNRWDEKIEVHPLNATITEILEILDIEFDNIDEGEAVEKRRLHKLITSLQDELKNIDSEIVPKALLDDIESILRNPNNWKHINGYRTHGNVKFLTNYNDSLDHYLMKFAMLTALSKKGRNRKSTKAMESSFDKFVNVITFRKKELESDLKQVSNSVIEQTSRLKELSDTITQKKQETDHLIAEWQKQQSDSQNQRNIEFNKDQKDRTDVFGTLLKETESEADEKLAEIILKTNNELNSSQDDFNKRIVSIIEDAENKHAAILELYQLVAGDSVASGYFKTAEEEKDKANIWHRSAIAFIMFTALWTGCAYVFDTSIGATGEILWSKVLKAFSVTGVLLFGAAYSAKQANLHRKNETSARWFALEVKAIDPFISSLTADDQKALKSKLTDRLFGRNHDSNENEENFVSDHVLKKFKAIADIVKS